MLLSLQNQKHKKLSQTARNCEQTKAEHRDDFSIHTANIQQMAMIPFQPLFV